jgi:hypothetical protein
MSSNWNTEYDLNRIIAKPLFFGLFSNVVAPMALLFVCYYLQGHGGMPDRLGDSSSVVFYLFAALALGEAGFAIWWRGKLFAAPMIRRRETFEADFAEQYAKRCRPLFLVIAAICLYGYIFYFLSGRFNESLMFVVFSFIAFQAVRPRHGMVQKLILRQQELVDKGNFLAS